MVSVAPDERAMSTARSTAFAAVFDPSVPTRILLYTSRNLARSDRGERGKRHLGHRHQLCECPERERHLVLRLASPSVLEAALQTFPGGPQLHERLAPDP